MINIFFPLILAFLFNPEGMAMSHNPEENRSHLSSPGSVFMTEDMIKRVRQNAETDSVSAKIVREIIDAASPWLVYSDDQLWEMMFGNTIKRSWMVWSDGYCPSCRKGVPMYDWKMDPHHNPWKVTCPECNEQFPKNDFEKYYRSGMDEHFIFDPSKADRSLLFNSEHPDPGDPLNKFAIDDGEGWVADGHRWRFIGAYLVYAQWKGLIVGGITKLSEAYVVTGDTAYSHRAGVLLDRVADLYPSHDFSKQGLVYENPGIAGYVSTWHDACQETKQIAISYDMIRKALSEDTRLAEFLSIKAGKFNIEVKKTNTSDVLANIENGIIIDPQMNRGRIFSNYPQKDITLAILKNISGRPGDKDSVKIILDSLIKRSTAVDGLTGEKGLTGYSSYGSAHFAQALSLFSRPDPEFLTSLIREHPGIVEMFRFYIDVWSGMKHYPNIGDCDGFALPDTVYKGVYFSTNPGLNPSMFSFLWQMYEATGDHEFVQILYNENGKKSDGLPYDIFSPSPKKFRKEVENIIKKNGFIPDVKSVNKKDWHLSVLRAGSGDKERALWLDYDAGGYHSHADGLNIGLFAYGLDLIPDFGYPPVQFGGWDSNRAKWYVMTAAHNTVVVNGKNQINLAGNYNEKKGFEGQPYGKTTLWSDGVILKAVRAELPLAYDIEKYERTVAMADAGNDNFYIIDLFSVHGGSDHARMTYTHFGDISTSGLNPVKSNGYGFNTLLRNFLTDTATVPGWQADWKIEDRYNISTAKEDIHLRLTDLSERVSVSLAEAWITTGISTTEGEWIPSLVTRRKGIDSTLVSDFLSVIEPYCGNPFILHSKRIHTDPGYTAVEITLENGSRDVWITGNCQDNITEIKGTNGGIIRFRGDLALLRWNSGGKLVSVSVTRSDKLSVDGYELEMVPSETATELLVSEKTSTLVYGEKKTIRSLKYNNNTVSISMPARNKL